MNVTSFAVDPESILVLSMLGGGACLSFILSPFSFESHSHAWPVALIASQGHGNLCT